jgi:hypothetical protein
MCRIIRVRFTSIFTNSGIAGSFRFDIENEVKIEASFRLRSDIVAITSVNLVQVSLIPSGQQGLEQIALASRWLEECANLAPMPEKNDQYSANYSNVPGLLTNKKQGHLD